jgi:uncharacterized protein
MTGQLLVVTGGHRIDEVAFAEMAHAVCGTLGWEWRREEQPSAQALLSPAHAGEWDAILFHDLPGLHLRRGEPPAPFGPTQEIRDALTALFDTGIGVVATHHALAGWPAWDGWATALGGRYWYAPGTLRGRALPSSGYRWGDVHIDVVAPDHPVCAGLASFVIDDEQYLCPMFADEVVPLLATSDPADPRLFTSTLEAVVDGIETPCDATVEGSRLLAWAKVAGRSPVVYIQPGHSASTMRSPMYRRLLGNALSWVASDQARRWAMDAPAPF